MQGWYTTTYTNNSNTAWSVNVNSVTEHWGGSKACINGHSWGSWTTNQDAVFSSWTEATATDVEKYKITVSRSCATDSTHRESEEIIPTVSLSSDGKSYNYTYRSKLTSFGSYTYSKTRDVGTGIVTYTKSNMPLGKASGNWSRYNDKLVYGGGHEGPNLEIAVRTATAEADTVLVTSIIKPNVKSVAVDLKKTTGEVKLKAKNGEILAEKSGKGIISLDVSGLSESRKLGAYLWTRAYDANSTINKANSAGRGWNWFPALYQHQLQLQSISLQLNISNIERARQSI